MAATTVPRPTRKARRRRRTAPTARPLDRFLVGAAVVGLLVSAYLTLVDLSGGATLCPVGSDCDVVRASAFGHVAGLPVAALGIGYFVAVLAAALLRASWQPALLQLLGGVGLGATIVLVGIQGLVLGAWCPYCLVADAAALAIGLRVLWPGRPARPGQPAGGMTRGVIGAALAVAVLVAGYAVSPTAASGTDLAGSGPSGSAASAMTPDQLAALADHLRQSGAVFYGAYWCPHCQNQKQMFGAAASKLPYVECDPRGANAQPAACQAAGVQAYPTWVIGGQKVEGELSPSELARLSGFGG
jgi:uncharacterized membrane protein